MPDVVPTESDSHVEPSAMSDEDLLASLQDHSVGDLENDHTLADDTEEAEAEEEELEESESEEESEGDTEGDEVDFEEVAEKVESEESTEEAPKEEDSVETLMQLRLAEMEASVKAQESQAGRFTSRNGRLQQENDQLRTRLARLERQPEGGDQFSGEDDRGIAPPPVAPQPVSQDATSQFVTQQGMNEGKTAFWQDVTDGTKEEDLPEDDRAALAELVTHLQSEKGKAELADIQTSNDPNYARTAMRDLLTAGYWRLKRNLLSKRRKEMEAKKVDQAASLKRKKRTTTVSQSSKPARRRRKPAPSDPAEMNNDQLLASMGFKDMEANVR